MAPVEVFLRNIGKVILTVGEGEDAKLPSGQPERASLFIRGNKEGGQYLTGYDPRRQDEPQLQNLKPIKPGEKVSVDKNTVLRGR